MQATQGKFRAHWREVTGVFLKLGAVSYGGPAIMGIMQSEVQEKRAWLSKENFVEGLALVNMLPGAGATQLGIFGARTRRLVGWRARRTLLRAAGAGHHVGADRAL